MKDNFLNKYKHAVMFLYGFIYIPWFAYLEKTVVTQYHTIHMRLDDFIPFNEYFIIPYLLWFAYVAAAIAYFFFKDSKEFYRLTCFLFIGMTIFLIISTLYPNGHHLRPTVFARDNLFVHLVQQLYKTDTATNLFPSIHVFNSIVVHLSIVKSKHFVQKTWVRHGSFILMSLIVMSTLFTKQHSVFDVLTAIITVSCLYPLIYMGASSKDNKEAYERLNELS